MVSGVVGHLASEDEMVSSGSQFADSEHGSVGDGTTSGNTLSARLPDFSASTDRPNFTNFAEHTSITSNHHRSNAISNMADMSCTILCASSYTMDPATFSETGADTFDEGSRSASSTPVTPTTPSASHTPQAPACEVLITSQAYSQSCGYSQGVVVEPSTPSMGLTSPVCPSAPTKSHTTYFSGSSHEEESEYLFSDPKSIPAALNSNLHHGRSTSQGLGFAMPSLPSSFAQGSLVSPPATPTISRRASLANDEAGDNNSVVGPSGCQHDSPNLESGVFPGSESPLPKPHLELSHKFNAGNGPLTPKTNRKFDTQSLRSPPHLTEHSGFTPLLGQDAIAAPFEPESPSSRHSYRADRRRERGKGRGRGRAATASVQTAEPTEFTESVDVRDVPDDEVQIEVAQDQETRLKIYQAHEFQSMQSVLQKRKLLFAFDSEHLQDLTTRLAALDPESRSRYEIKLQGHQEERLLLARDEDHATELQANVIDLPIKERSRYNIVLLRDYQLRVSRETNDCQVAVYLHPSTAKGEERVTLRVENLARKRKYVWRTKYIFPAVDDEHAAEVRRQIESLWWSHKAKSQIFVQAWKEIADYIPGIQDIFGKEYGATTRVIRGRHVFVAYSEQLAGQMRAVLRPDTASNIKVLDINEFDCCLPIGHIYPLVIQGLATTYVDRARVIRLGGNYLTEFIVFGKLPVELRYMIWRFAANAEGPRVVGLNSGREVAPRFFSDTPAPVLLHICHEARAEAQRTLVPLFARSQYAPGKRIWFDFEKDTLRMGNGTVAVAKKLALASDAGVVADRDRVRHCQVAFPLHHAVRFYDTIAALIILSPLRGWPVIESWTFTGDAANGGSPDRYVVIEVPVFASETLAWSFIPQLIELLRQEFRSVLENRIVMPDCGLKVIYVKDVAAGVPWNAELKRAAGTSLDS